MRPMRPNPLMATLIISTMLLDRPRPRCSGVKPKCLNSSPAGADSPKRSMPTTAPSQADVLAPVVGHARLDRDLRAGPAAAPSSGKPRPGGRRRWCEGIDTTRTAMPSPASSFCASSASCTSEPVAMMTARGAGGVGEHVAAARDACECSSCLAEAAGSGATAASAVGPFLRSSAARPGDRGLDRVARAPDVHVRDQAQARGVLDRLVRRAVLAEADRVVREDVDRRACFISAAMRSALRA